MYIYNVYYIYIYVSYVYCMIVSYYPVTIAVKRCENPILSLANLSQGWPMQHVKANVLGLAVFLSILEQCSRLRSPGSTGWVDRGPFVSPRNKATSRSSVLYLGSGIPD